MREPPRISPPHAPDSYRGRWRRWSGEPEHASAGVTFDRTTTGAIIAPPGKFRVCAYHIDFDEHPTVWIDVETIDEASHIRDNIRQTCADWNVDFAVTFDDVGRQV